MHTEEIEDESVPPPLEDVDAPPPLQVLPAPQSIPQAAPHATTTSLSTLFAGFFSYIPGISQVFGLDEAPTTTQERPFVPGRALGRINSIACLTRELEDHACGGGSPPAQSLPGRELSPLQAVSGAPGVAVSAAAGAGTRGSPQPPPMIPLPQQPLAATTAPPSPPSVRGTMAGALKVAAPTALPPPPPASPLAALLPQSEKPIPPLPQAQFLLPTGEDSEEEPFVRAPPPVIHHLRRRPREAVAALRS